MFEDNLLVAKLYWLQTGVDQNFYLCWYSIGQTQRVSSRHAIHNTASFVSPCHSVDY